jgi:hypothetical protein
MTSTSSFNATVAGLTFVLLITFAVPAEAAWPRLLMVYNASLTRPPVGEEPKDIVQVFDQTGEAVDQDDLDRRPYFELALFWGDTWNRYMNEGRPASALKPEEVTPFDSIPIRGRFYPACGVHPAQITLTKVNSPEIRDIWPLSPDGLKVLEKLGVPIKSDCN